LRTRAARYEPLINSAALRHGVDARWLWIIAYLETRFRPELVSPKGARGMMQFMDATSERYNLADPHDAAASIDAAARYVRDLQKRFGNRLDLILASYNAGEGAVDAYLKGYALRLPNGRIINPQGLKLGGLPPYAETRNYVTNGLNLARLLSVPNILVLSANSPTIRRSLGGASRASIFAPRQGATRPQLSAVESPASRQSEPVIRSIRVAIPADPSSTQ
jgi:soluble lytic murein transglycosylase-like protein